MEADNKQRHTRPREHIQTYPRINARTQSIKNSNDKNKQTDTQNKAIKQNKQHLYLMSFIEQLFHADCMGMPDNMDFALEPQGQTEKY